MREVVFVDAARSAFTNMGGGLRELSAVKIASFVVKGLVERSGIMERGKVDGLFCGTALRDCDVLNPARSLAIYAGLPIETEAHYVEMQCGSAITAINHAAAQIAMGFTDVLLVGGMESYSTQNCYVATWHEPYKALPLEVLNMRFSPDDAENINMIQVSDGMAKKWGISRTQCDEFALRSQQRLDAAYASGLIGGEIVPCVFPATKKLPERVVDKDEFPKPASTLEKMSALRPVYEGGVTTAANASGRNDGAAFVLMMSADKARELGYTPFARWIMGADVGCRPSEMGIGPVAASLKALKLAGLSLGDMDVMECNEAFAAQNLAVIKELEHQTGLSIDQEKWNPNGGAIAIGHPNGASGARIAWFAMKQLEKTGGKYGLFTSCCGGGQGTTTIIENLRR